MNQVTVWTSQWTERFLPFLFRIRLRAAPQGCRNLLRTPARESGTGNEPRIRTVRQLAAAAGDGWLGSAGSPGQLETSLNSGYTVGPCNSYLEGPTPIFSKLGCSRIARLSPPSSSSLAEETAPPLAPPHHGGRAIADARGPRGAQFPTARDFADARSYVRVALRPGARCRLSQLTWSSALRPRFTRRSQVRGCSFSDRAGAVIGCSVGRLVR